MLRKRWISNTDALRLGARPLVLPARDLLRLQSEYLCPPTWRHIRSHTDRLGVMSKGNAKADKCAGEAAAPPRCPALTYEGAYTFWRDDTPSGEDQFSGPFGTSLATCAHHSSSLDAPPS